MRRRTGLFSRLLAWPEGGVISGPHRVGRQRFDSGKERPKIRVDLGAQFDELCQVVSVWKRHVVVSQERLQTLFDGLLSVESGRVQSPCAQCYIQCNTIALRFPQPAENQLSFFFHRLSFPRVSPWSQKLAAPGPNLPPLRACRLKPPLPRADPPGPHRGGRRAGSLARWIP